MLDLSQAVISRLAIHRVGNKAQEEDPIVSAKLADLTPELEETLVGYFTKPFKGDLYYKFTHPSGLQYNEVHNFVKSMFADETAVYLQSVNILKHLHHMGVNPNTKSGEVYVAYMKNCMLDEEPLDAIGIFKSENKDTFLAFRNERDGLEADALVGLNIKNLDKGCIVFNSEEETGYRVVAIDRSKKDGIYWFDDFLQVLEDTDDNTHTRDALNLCNAFAKDMLAPQHGKKDEVLFMKHTLDYFDKAETFELGEFADIVVADPEYNTAFKGYVETYETRIGRKVENDFSISRPMLKTMKPKFKDLIKLDTNIHIKLNFDNLESGRRFIERGYDADAKMSYYKVYFNEELG